MRRRDFLKTTVMTGLAWREPERSFGRAAAPVATAGYRVGDTVDPEVFVLTNRMRPVTLASQVTDLTKVVYLLIFGGAYAAKPPDKRGGLWCVDSVDDMAIHRTIYLNYADKGVTFVPVATPPVYGGERYGYPNDVFLTEPDDAEAYQKAVVDFVQKTESLKEDGTVPFDPVFYDPRFRLLDNPSEHRHVAAYGKVYSWQGRFKWHEDGQSYGTPTTWLLDRNLRVMRDPFFGNLYEAVPLEIRYTIRDVARALDESVAKS